MTKWRVGKGKGGVRLLGFITEHSPEEFSKKTLKKAIEQKYCLVNGSIETFSSSILKEGDTVTLDLGAFSSKEQKEIVILYEDESLIAVNKPAGVLTDIGHLKIAKGFLVHRLDKETSGVLLVAKTKDIQAKLEELFKQHLIQKLYLAIVDGKVLAEEKKIDNFLGKKGSYAGQTIYGAVSKEKGKRALTHIKRLDASTKASLVACEPKTGRTHQIRVHLSEMGHPILGDRQYAKKFLSSFVPKRNLLHAYQLRLTHPQTGKELKIVAPIPIDFQMALKELNLKISNKNRPLA